MRGRLPKAINGLENHDFDKLAKSPKFSARERLRFLALAHIKEGKSFSCIAEMLRVGPRIISVWASKFRKDGIDGLRDRYKGGAHPYLHEDKHEEFRQAVIELQASRKGGRIRGDDVRTLMREKFGIQCSLATTYNTLKRVNLVWITGRSRHPKGNEEIQLTFKKNSKRGLSK